MPSVAIDRRAALSVAVALCAPSIGRGQGTVWPSGPVRLVVPFGPGGAIDTLSRTVANAFPGVVPGGQLIVENRGGGGGTIAGIAVTRSKPDGATLMMADLGANGIAGELVRGLSYDPATAFTPVCHLVKLPLAVLVPGASPARDIAGLFALAKAQPDLPYANPGNGYVGHLAQELMLRRAGVSMVPVVYRSGAEVVRSLVANETGSSVITVSTSLPFIREGRIRALAVCSPTRIPQLPDVPTLAESLPGFEATVWHGIVGPPGLAPEVVAAANAAFNAVLLQPEVRRAVEQNQAGEVVGGPAAAFGAFIAAEIARWTPVIRQAGIRAE